MNRIGWTALVLGAACAVPLVAQPAPAHAASATTIWAGDTGVVEGTFGTARTAKFSITLDAPSSVPVKVNYTFANGSATGADYDATHGTRTLVFNPARASGLTPTTKFVQVAIAPDAQPEPTEYFRLVLSAPVNATLGRAAGVATIFDDDPTTAPTIGVGDATVTEGDVGASRSMQFALTLSKPSTTPVTVKYQLLTASASAADFDDHKAKVLTATFTPARKTGLTAVEKFIPVAVKPDLIGEPAERFVVQLSNPSAGWAIGRAQGSGWIGNDESITTMDAGRDHSCALVASSVFCVGLGADGEMGNGANDTVNTQLVPVQGLIGNVVQLDVGDFHSCALTTAGGVKCWGMNAYGQLGNGTTTDSNVPVDVLGLDRYVKEISVGVQHTCAVYDSADGFAFCWGDNDDGQLGIGAAGGFSNRPVMVAGLGFRHISAGAGTTCAIDTAADASCWGRNTEGAVGDGTFTDRPWPTSVAGLGSHVVEIATGGGIVGEGAHTCAVLDTSELKCWGANATGELGTGWLGNWNQPWWVVGMASGVTHVAVGGWLDGGSTCATTSDGAVHCWGSNAYGQLGDGGGPDRDVPVVVSALGPGSAATAVTVGSYHACADLASGEAKCWGHNPYGALGDGTRDEADSPVTVLIP